MNALKFWRWKLYWQVLAAMALGALAGTGIRWLDAEPTIGLELRPNGVVTSIDAEQFDGNLEVGDTVVEIGGRAWVAIEFGRDILPAPAERVEIVARRIVEGQTLEIRTHTIVRTGADSDRDRATAPLHFLAELFTRALQMLIVPLIATSLIAGVTRLGDLRVLGRVGVRTLLYYLGSSLLAVLVGLCVVNVLAPGSSAGGLALTETVSEADLQRDESLIGIFLRMVPENVVEALSDNGSILQVIFFSILFGVSTTLVAKAEGDLVTRFFSAAFEVMMRMTELVLFLLPLGVFALIGRVVANTGLGGFAPLLWFMGSVVIALVLHAVVILPLLLWGLGRVSPWGWARAVSPALITAFSTSSSSLTLPVSLRATQKRGGVSQRVSSFALPLGATINMDGTALYECVGVLFLAQYYAATGGFELTLSTQAIVVVTALLASIGAAGIPSAGLVMMTTILRALDLPIEGVVLLLAVDRPLDMLRTTVNVWSDTTCAAIIARGEGEQPGLRDPEPEDTIPAESGPSETSS